MWLFILLILVQGKSFEDTKGVIRICKSKKDRQHNGQKIRICKSKKDRQHNGQKIPKG
jgi:hypothetical protein